MHDDYFKYGECFITKDLYEISLVKECFTLFLINCYKDSK